MSIDDVMIYEGTNYCDWCATQMWEADARQAIEDRSPRNAQRYIAGMGVPEEAGPDDIDTYAVHCYQCGDVLVGQSVTCDGCGSTCREGDRDWCDFEEAVDEGHYREGDYGGLRTTWCEECRDRNHPTERGDVLVWNDGRGYALRFVEEYTGELTYRQPDGQSRFTAVPMPIYVAGCRRFTVADALCHWSDPGHYSNYRARDLNSHSPDNAYTSAADLLFRAVLAHAMRRALPNLRNRLADPYVEADT